MSRDSDAKLQNDKPSAATRRARGFTHTGGLVSDRVRGVSEKRGFAQVKLLTRWTEIVGTEIATHARPVKVSYAREGFGATLTLLVDGAHAPEIQMRLHDIQQMVNACYGYNAISRIKLTQTATHGFAELSAEFTPKPQQKPLRPEQADALHRDTSGIADDGLRASLERLGHSILTR